MKKIACNYMLMMCEFFEYRFAHHDDAKLVRYKKALLDYITWNYAFISFFFVWTKFDKQLKPAELLEKAEPMALATFATIPGF